MRRVGQVLLRLPPSPPPGSAPTKLIVATDLLELCEPAVRQNNPHQQQRSSSTDGGGAGWDPQQLMARSA